MNLKFPYIYIHVLNDQKKCPKNMLKMPKTPFLIGVGLEYLREFGFSAEERPQSCGMLCLQVWCLTLDME